MMKNGDFTVFIHQKYMLIREILRIWDEMTLDEVDDCLGELCI